MFGRHKDRRKGRGRKGKRLHHGRERCHGSNLISLDSSELNREYVVMCNPDRKTVEMGIFKGGIVTVQKNDPADSKLIVAVGESRYIIPKDLARKILVR